MPLLTVDLLACASMKNVANWDKWCELQNLVNQRIFECKLCPLGIQGASLSERRVKPSHSGVAREL